MSASSGAVPAGSLCRARSSPGLAPRAAAIGLQEAPEAPARAPALPASGKGFAAREALEHGESKCRELTVPRHRSPCIPPLPLHCNSLLGETALQVKPRAIKSQTGNPSVIHSQESARISQKERTLTTNPGYQCKWNEIRQLHLQDWTICLLYKTWCHKQLWH